MRPLNRKPHIQNPRNDGCVEDFSQKASLLGFWFLTAVLWILPFSAEAQTTQVPAGLSILQTQDSVVLRIKTNGPPTFTSYSLHSPERWVLEVPSSLVRPITVPSMFLQNHPILQAILITERAVYGQQKVQRWALVVRSEPNLSVKLAASTVVITIRHKQLPTKPSEQVVLYASPPQSASNSNTPSNPSPQPPKGISAEIQMRLIKGWSGLWSKSTTPASLTKIAQTNANVRLTNEEKSTKTERESNIDWLSDSESEKALLKWKPTDEESTNNGPLKQRWANIHNDQYQLFKRLAVLNMQAEANKKISRAKEIRETKPNNLEQVGLTSALEKASPNLASLGNRMEAVLAKEETTLQKQEKRRNKIWNPMVLAYGNSVQKGESKRFAAIFQAKQQQKKLQQQKAKLQQAQKKLAQEEAKEKARRKRQQQAKRLAQGNAKQKAKQRAQKVEKQTQAKARARAKRAKLAKEQQQKLTKADLLAKQKREKEAKRIQQKASKQHASKQQAKVKKQTKTKKQRRAKLQQKTKDLQRSQRLKSNLLRKKQQQLQTKLLADQKNKQKLAKLKAKQQAQVLAKRKIQVQRQNKAKKLKQSKAKKQRQKLAKLREKQSKLQLAMEQKSAQKRAKQRNARQQQAREKQKQAKQKQRLAKQKQRAEELADQKKRATARKLAKLRRNRVIQMEQQAWKRWSRIKKRRDATVAFTQRKTRNAEVVWQRYQKKVSRKTNQIAAYRLRKYSGRWSQVSARLARASYRWQTQMLPKSLTRKFYRRRKRSRWIWFKSRMRVYKWRLQQLRRRRRIAILREQNWMEQQRRKFAMAAKKKAEERRRKKMNKKKPPTLLDILNKLVPQKKRLLRR